MDETTALVALVTGPTGALGLAIWQIKWMRSEMVRQRKAWERLGVVLEKVAEQGARVEKALGNGGVESTDPGGLRVAPH